MRWSICVVRVLIALAITSVFVIGQTRFIARDEGFYLYAAKLITQGQTPYVDFFLPQAPVMPYLYAGWFWLVGSSWVSARILGSLIAIGCGLFVYLLATRAYGRRAGVVTVIFLACTATFQLWMSLGKNVGLALLLYLAGVYFFAVKRSYFLSGLLIGLCVITRLTFLPLLIILAIPGARDLRGYLVQLRGVLLGLLPVAAVTALFIFSGSNLVENVFTYHLERTRLSDVQLAANKRYIMLSLLGVRDCFGGGGRQFAMLLLGGLISFYVSARDSRVHTIVLSSAVMFAVISFLPAPTYVQYFSVVGVLLVAPLVHAVLSLGEAFARRCVTQRAVCVAHVLCVSGVLVLYLGAGVPDFYRFLVSGDRVIGVGDRNRKAWTISAMSEVAKRIDKLNTSGSPVFSSWPGYLLESKSEALEGTENHFGVAWASSKQMSRERAAGLRVLSRQHIPEAFDEGRFDAAVLFVGRDRTSPLGQELYAHGMVKAEEYRGIHFLTRRSSNDEAS